MGDLRRLDKLFGGERGAAERVLANMKRTYGPKDGQAVFDGTVAKRKRQARVAGRRGRKR